jgi:DNA polymerase I-like protein with 3'-5' exonuclease and polymerase domains
VNEPTFAVVDFETEKIGPRPAEYPPKPVGVAIRWPHGVSEYLAWGHPEGNNCTIEEATRAVRKAYESTVIFHNAKFDMEVAWKWLKLPFPKRWHDTLLLAYLYSPDEFTFALKPMAAKFVHMPPEERDLVREWILANVPGATKKHFAEHIHKAPVALVGPYAIGDVERTWKLFHHFYKPVIERQAIPYQRERRLLPYLTDAERRGIRVDRGLLVEWQAQLELALHRCDHLIRSGLDYSTLNLDSDEDLANALERNGLVTHWETPDGVPFPCIAGHPAAQPPPVAVENPFGDAATVTEVPKTRSMSKGALERCCTDKDLVAQLQYRNTAATMLRTFVEPWLVASAIDGRLHTHWHQTRGAEKNGTRTGRIASSDPNLSNVPNPNEAPAPFGLPPLPNLRCAFLPEEDHVWISADYSQQELRVTAHYEGQQMQRAYILNPALDLHAFAQTLIVNKIGKTFPRKHVKNVAFASVYGAGLPKLARMMGVTEAEAEEIRDAYFGALPGLPNLIARVKQRSMEKKYVISHGGRVLTVEEPKVIKGHRRTFEYKMPNKLIQGSAADQTKEAIAVFCEAGGAPYFISQVYDEINISVPREHAAYYALMLRRIMIEALPLLVPTLVDIEVGPTWGDLKPMELT